MKLTAYLFLLILSVPFGTAAQGLEIHLDSPSVVVRVPDVEPIEFGQHPNASAQPASRLMGTKGTLTASMLVPVVPLEISPMQCASWLAGGVLSRFTPPLDTVRFVKAGENAYVLVFSFKVEGLEQLKAFALSGTGKGHCIEVHMSRTAPSDEQRKAWLSGFTNVVVEAK
ncbi:MAG: hypothetical protein HZC23_02570 [Rhodocyclales bacterium]|nr:hypothetical protein [Rhodocyclales bacterium]